jgi:hypothetical protein
MSLRSSIPSSSHQSMKRGAGRSVDDCDDVLGVPPSNSADPQPFPGEHAADRRRDANRFDDDLQIRRDPDVPMDLHRPDGREVVQLEGGTTERVVPSRLRHAQEYDHSCLCYAVTTSLSVRPTDVVRTPATQRPWSYRPARPSRGRTPGLGPRRSYPATHGDGYVLTRPYTQRSDQKAHDGGPTAATRCRNETSPDGPY